MFDNGLPIDPTLWVRGGVLRATPVPPCGCFKVRSDREQLPVDNLCRATRCGGVTQSLIEGTDRALLLTCRPFATLLLTGLTHGVYLVEKGEIVGAVNNFRFNESPVDLLAKTTEVGRSERALSREWNEYFNRTMMPPLRVEGFNMSLVSPAT